MSGAVRPDAVGDLSLRRPAASRRSSTRSTLPRGSRHADRRRPGTGVAADAGSRAPRATASASGERAGDGASDARGRRPAPSSPTNVCSGCSPKSTSSPASGVAPDVWPTRPLPPRSESRPRRSRGRARTAARRPQVPRARRARSGRSPRSRRRAAPAPSRARVDRGRRWSRSRRRDAGTAEWRSWVRAPGDGALRVRHEYPSFLYRVQKRGVYSFRRSTSPTVWSGAFCRMSVARCLVGSTFSRRFGRLISFQNFIAVWTA